MCSRVLAGRLLCVILHILTGLCTCVFVIPWIGAARRMGHIQRWSRRVLRTFGVTVEAGGEPVPANVLLVANHISWVDVFVIKPAPVAFRRQVGSAALAADRATGRAGGRPVQAIAISYVGDDGNPHPAVEYIAETSLAENMVAIPTGPPIRARLHALAPIAPEGAHRRAPALATEEQIRAALASGEPERIHRPDTYPRKIRHN
jgi:1-acyl-sn-glycerol-3-phosphate acyltransferase